MVLVRLLLIAIQCSLLAPALHAQDPQSIPWDQFERIHKLVKRHQGEWKWAELPWVINFADAQRKSIAEGKPIFAVTCAQGCIAGFT